MVAPPFFEFLQINVVQALHYLAQSPRKTPSKHQPSAVPTPKYHINHSSSDLEQPTTTKFLSFCTARRRCPIWVRFNYLYCNLKTLKYVNNLTSLQTARMLYNSERIRSLTLNLSSPKLASTFLFSSIFFRICNSYWLGPFISEKTCLNRPVV